ncbi:MAG: hypothetical protein ABGX83_10110 [Nitrospira sp.]|nr:hypothetical protein [Candidatus Manganitrophaceae bacterium]
MENELAAKLDPDKASDESRKSTIEKLVYTANIPDPKIWPLVISAIQKEPVKWIRQLEVRLLNKFPFSADMADAILSLLSCPFKDVHLEGAILLRSSIVRLVAEKKTEERKAFEEKLLDPIISQLNNKEIVAEPQVWLELYKTLSNFSQSDRVTQTIIEIASTGGEDSLYSFSQYVQGKYPPEALEALLTGFPSVKLDRTTVHLLRTLRMNLPKEGAPSGFPSTEPIIQALLDGARNRSENIRIEASSALTSRAKAARKLKTLLPLEDEVWECMFKLYSERLTSATAIDKDRAREALQALPANGERLSRMFDLLHQTEDELEKQNIVGLLGTFKADETRDELIKLLKTNFAALHLIMQKTTIDSISSYIPDEEVETELEKLLEGKGLHAEVQAKLADKLFAQIPSLKARLKRWLALNEKTKRPMLERFDLPIMHIKVISSVRKLVADPEIQALLKALEPLLVMNDVKLKLHETLKSIPKTGPVSRPDPKILPLDQVSKALITLITPLSKAKIIFSGFSLPEEFGGTEELEFGNTEQTKAQGLGIAATEMGKDFVLKTIEDIFSEDLETPLPTDARFRLVQEEEGVFTVAVLTPESASSQS